MHQWAVENCRLYSPLILGNPESSKLLLNSVFEILHRYRHVITSLLLPASNPTNLYSSTSIPEGTPDLSVLPDIIVMNHRYSYYNLLGVILLLCIICDRQRSRGQGSIISNIYGETL